MPAKKIKGGQAVSKPLTKEQEAILLGGKKKPGRPKKIKAGNALDVEYSPEVQLEQQVPLSVSSYSNGNIYDYLNTPMFSSRLLASGFGDDLEEFFEDTDPLNSFMKAIASLHGTATKLNFQPSAPTAPLGQIPLDVDTDNALRMKHLQGSGNDTGIIVSSNLNKKISRHEK